MHPISVLVSVVVLFVTRFLLVRRRRRQQERRLGCEPLKKYPHRLPWFLDPWGGDLKSKRLQGIKSGRYNRLFQEQFVRCGPTFAERSPVGNLICTMDENNCRTILAVKDDDYCKQEVQTGGVQQFLGRGIFTNEGTAWRHSRDMIKPLFVGAESSDIDRLKRHVDRLFSVMPRDERAMDVSPWISKLFLDSASEFILGECFNSLGDNAAVGDEFMAAVRACLRELGKGRVRGGIIPLQANKDYEKNCDTVHAFIDRQVARVLTAAADDKPPTRYIFIDELAKVEKDPIKLRFELLNVFMPASESVPNMFSTMLFHLARHPDIWADLRRQALALGDEPLTFEVVRSLHSFRNVIHESIRIHGSSGRLSRTALRDTVIPRGGGADGDSPVLVRKGTRVMLELFSKLHDPDVWGEDAEVFRPSRFEGRRLKWEFVAFSGGSRICPARQQVITQLSYFLLRLVTEFEQMDNQDPCLEYVEAISVMTQSRNGVQVKLRETKTA